jgi:hypothetical protein
MSNASFFAPQGEKRRIEKKKSMALPSARPDLLREIIRQDRCAALD